MDTTDDLLMTDEQRWQAVLARDASFDGAFVYAVRSTGVYCRPSCPSRKAGRRQVTFFVLPEAARNAGYRACKRCRPEIATVADPRLAAVRRACRAIEARDDGLPTLDELAGEVGLSAHHLQRMFKRLTGVSPHQYGEAVRISRVKQSLRAGEAVASALYGAGYGSSSRLYEQAPSRLGMTPASYAKGGLGAEIVFTIVDDARLGALGRMLLARTGRGICMISFADDEAFLEAELLAEYPRAGIHRDDGAFAGQLDAILDLAAGGAPAVNLPLDVQATAFQAQVWARLKAIPPGETRTYGEIATELGRPGAARAVGRACASNPVSLIVPCHRVVGGDGTMHGYRWGAVRKQELLARERKRS